ncbi:glutamine--fructose-6-phosphate transaminase (isomerizing) [Globomyces sp. JEL0801]|nr:glutamine--fructose-6-phosphate transaminase (isomerizing) [Globomyces sp. JEL0801]
MQNHFNTYYPQEYSLDSRRPMTPSSFYSPPTSQLVEPSHTYYVSPTSNYMISPPHSVLMTPKSETFAPILPPIDNLFTGNFSLHKHNIGQYQSVDDLFNEVVLEQDEYGGFHTMNETFIRHDMDDLKRFSENVTITTVDDANYNPEQEPSDELQTSKTNNFTSEFQLNFDINEPQFTKSHACPYKGCKNRLVIDSDDNEEFVLMKHVGKVTELSSKFQDHPLLLKNKAFVAHCAFGHLRWATHGAPTLQNAHPHGSDIRYDFVIVHNGFITNSKELRMVLVKFGYQFESETDSECIAVLAKYVFDTQKKFTGQSMDFSNLVKVVCAELEGSYAIIFKSTHFPNEIVCVRQGSPLMIGIKSEKKIQVDFVDVNIEHAPCNYHSKIDYIVESDASLLGVENPTIRRTQSRSFLGKGGDIVPIEYFIASNTAAIVQHTKKVLYLEDDDLAHIAEGELRLGNFPHLMLKEIFDLTDTLFNTVRGRVHFDGYSINLGGLKAQLSNIRRSRRILFVGCGSSYYACVAIKSVFADLCELPISVELATAISDDQLPIFRDDVCIFVSQSGETKSTLAALLYCKERGALCLGVTNTVGSTISKYTHCGVHINSGPDMLAYSIKAYPAQVIALTLIALHISEDHRGSLDKRVQIIQSLNNLSSDIKTTLQTQLKIKELSQSSLKDVRQMMIVSRGYQLATALEGSLKIKQFSSIQAEGISGDEMLLGLMALVKENIPVLIVMTKDRHYVELENTLKRIIKYGGTPIVFASDDDQ